MLPTEGTVKRKPKEEDGGGRQKKEQDGDHFLHKSQGRKDGVFQTNGSPSLPQLHWAPQA